MVIWLRFTHWRLILKKSDRSVNVAVYEDNTCNSPNHLRLGDLIMQGFKQWLWMACLFSLTRKCKFRGVAIILVVNDTSICGQATVAYQQRNLHQVLLGSAVPDQEHAHHQPTQQHCAGDTGLRVLSLDTAQHSNYQCNPPQLA